MTLCVSSQVLAILISQKAGLTLVRKNFVSLFSIFGVLLDPKTLVIGLRLDLTQLGPESRGALADH